MKNKSKQIIILLGPPGSGKGTQGVLLSAKFDLFYFETSGIIEQKIKLAKKNDFIEAEGKKYYFVQQKKLWESGKLCDPPFVVHLIQEKIEKLAREGEGIVISGSPRTLYEGEKLIPILKKLYGTKNIKVVLLELSSEQTIWRNTHRRICELMRHPIIYTEENERLSKCPLDGSNLLKRKGLDDEDSIRIRLKEYKERTYPLIKYFQKQGFKIKKVNGEQSVVDVFRNVLRAVGGKKYL